MAFEGWIQQGVWHEASQTDSLLPITLFFSKVAVQIAHGTKNIPSDLYKYPLAVSWGVKGSCQSHPR